MARNFSGASQRASSITNWGITANPVTIFIRARRNSTTTEGYAAGVGSGTDSLMIGMRGDTGGDPIQCRAAHSGAIGVNAGTYSADVWTACTIQCKGIGSSDLVSFKDTTKVTGSNASVQFVMGNYTIYLASFPDTSALLAGHIACLAAWSVALTDDEVASLAAGFSPRRIRPQSLAAYNPFIRSTQDLRGRITGWTENGSPTVSDHPRSYGY
jgi:hypothetical protein